MRSEKTPSSHNPAECQGKRARSHYKRWTDEDDRLLLRLWGRRTTERVASALGGRTATAVRARARLLLGSYREDQRLWSQNAMVRATGYDKTYVIQAAKELNIRGAVGDRWVVGNRDYEMICAWLRDNAHGTRYEGYSYREVRDRLGCSQSWLFNAAKILGIDARKGSRFGQFTDDEVERLRGYYATRRKVGRCDDERGAATGDDQAGS